VKKNIPFQKKHVMKDLSEEVRTMDLAAKTFIQVSNQHYREQYGLCYEDFSVGAIIEHEPRRTIVEIDNMWGTLICMDQNPAYIDEYYASKTECGKRIVSNSVTFCIVNGPTVNSMSAKAIANLGWDKIRVFDPVFIGDTLYSISEVLEVRESNSRPTQGIVKIRTSGYKTDDESLVMICERNFLVPKRKHQLTQYNI
jgi:itaconyl-CoA hydratase